MSEFLYGFEAKEIQSFVFRSARLRDMAGGSELVNRLCEGFLDEALLAFNNGSPFKVMSRGAGGARVRFTDETVALAFFEAWPFIVDRFAPGVRVVQALVPFADSKSDAMDHCREGLRAARNAPMAQLPEIGPLIDRSPLTGAAAVRWDKAHGERELVDIGISRRRGDADTRKSLLGKLSGDKDSDLRSWPLDFDEIAKSEGESAFLAVVHADGNDLGVIIGAMLRGAAKAEGSGDSAFDLFSEFSRAVEASTEEAAQEAFRRVLKPDFEKRSMPGKESPTYAARPIVLGGDDLTIVMRADLAFGFMTTFLEAFETISAAKLKTAGLAGKTGIPACLTACGGIAFVKKSYPFSRAYGLCESLCTFSKTKAKASRTAGGLVPSCFTFHRVTASLSESFKEIRETELSGPDGLELHAGPYAVGVHGGNMRRLEDLLKAAESIGNGKVPGGSVRKLVSELYRSRSAAVAGFERMLQVNPKAGEGFRQALEMLGGDRDCPMFFGGGKASMLPDVHAARSIIKGSEAGEND